MDSMDSNRHWMSLFDGRGCGVLLLWFQLLTGSVHRVLGGQIQPSVAKKGCQITNAMRLEGQLKRFSLLTASVWSQSRAPPFPLRLVSGAVDDDGVEGHGLLNGVTG